MRIVGVLATAAASHTLIANSGMGAGGAYLFSGFVGTIFVIAFGGQFRVWYVLLFTVLLLLGNIFYSNLTASQWLLASAGTVLIPVLCAYAVSSAISQRTSPLQDAETGKESRTIADD